MICFEPESMDAAFHFSAEEYIMRTLQPKAPVLMLWRTHPTVMLGVNQIAAAEMDLKLAKIAGIAVVRRSSGGGAIYTDPGTLLCTIILPWDPKVLDPKDVVRRHLAGPVVDALAASGVTATLEGRNDILVEGKKISGIAQFVRYGYLCSHGSLLFDADLDALGRILTVDEGKIAAKALRSVRSRVTNIRDHLPPIPEMDMDGFQKRLVDAWGADSKEPLILRSFTAEEIGAIKGIRGKKYGSDDWNLGRTPPFTFRNERRFPGGKVEVSIRAEKGAIAHMAIHGDFLSLSPAEELAERLRGLAFRREAIEEALASEDLTLCLGHISAESFLELLFP